MTRPLFAAFVRDFFSLYANSDVFNLEYDASSSDFNTDGLLHLANWERIAERFQTCFGPELTQRAIMQSYGIQISPCAIVHNDYSHKTAADRQEGPSFAAKEAKISWKAAKR